MNTPANSSFNRLVLRLLLLVAFSCISGCATPDPVKGWKCWYANVDPPNQHDRGGPNYHIDEAIIADSQEFQKNLMIKHPKFLPSGTYYYEGPAGEHAVKLVIETGLREYVEYLLIYDKDNARTKVIKGRKGHQFHL